MTGRALVLVCTGALAIAGCGPDAETPTVAAPAAPAREFSGTYRVTGKTVEKGTSNSRPLRGTIILVQTGDGYTSTFDLETELPTPEGQKSHAQVVGKGEGVVADEALRGTADTQIVWADVPGVHTDFAFMPKRYGPRLASSSVAKLQPDGTLLIEIDSTGVAGSQYTPTHTTLRGTRIESGKAKP